MSCKAHYKGQPFDSIEKAIEAVKADHGTTLEAKASNYYEAYRKLTTTTSEKGSQKDLNGFAEYIQERAYQIKKDFGVTSGTPNEIDLTDLDISDEFNSMPFEEGSENNDTAEKVQDYNQTAQQKKLAKDGLSDFLVIDKITDTVYNSGKQSQVVSSIVAETTTAMKTGVTAKKAFEVTKKKFERWRDLYHSASKNFDSLTEKQKKDFNIISADEAEEMYIEYDKVLRNWPQFEKHSKVKLLKLFGITEDTKLENAETQNEKGDAKPQTDEEVSESEDALDGYDNIDSNLDRISFEDGSVFRVDGKDTASARLRLFIALRKAPGKSFLNLSTFMEFDTVYDELQTILAGVNPTFADVVAEMSIYAAKKPYLKALIEELQMESTQVQNEFVSNFSTHHQAFLLSDFKTGRRTDDTTYFKLRNLASNRNDVVKSVQNSWIENQKSSPMVSQSKGVLVINKAEAKKFADAVDAMAIQFDVDVLQLQELLKTTGIEMSIDALNHFKTTSVVLTNTSFADHFKKGGIFKYIADSLNSNDESKAGDVESQLDLNNPLTGVSSEGTSITILAKLEAQFSDSVRSNSHKDVEGKTIFSYGLNNHMSHTIRRLLEKSGSNSITEALSNISYSKRSVWLKEIRQNKEFRDAFKLFYLDGFKKQGPGNKGVKRSKQSKREMELQFLSMFQNGANKQGYFVYPTVSDKSTTPVIRALKQSLLINVNNEGELMFGASSTTAIKDILFAEFDRIEKYKQPENKTERYSGYDDITEISAEDGGDSSWVGGALSLYSFPQLNEFLEVNRKVDGSFYITVENKQVLTKMVIDLVRQQVYDKVKTWEKLGIVTDKRVMFDDAYVSEISKKISAPIKDEKTGRTFYNVVNNKALATYAAADLELNYIIANAGIKQLISGDPATQYKKGTEETIVEHVKRLAKDIAPGKDGVWKKPTYRIVYFNDLKIDSKHLDNYIKTLGAVTGSAYKNVNVTDAQEYTTLQEHIDVLQAYGKIKDSLHSSITKKITDAKETATEYTLSDEELKLILQPMKPVQTYNEIDANRDVAMPIYIKSSSFPLIPQLTKGTELDKIRKEMEAYDIQRAAYISAVKVGSKNVIDIWQGREIKEDLTLKNKASTLSRSGFRIQQEVPYKEKKTKITTVTQMNKLLFEGILHIQGMTELRAEKEAIRKELFQDGIREWHSKIGVTITADLDGKPKVTVTNLTKLRDALIEEATSRGYPLNDIQSLQTSPDGTKFITPLTFNASAKKFESLLMSLITSSAIKHTVNGKSYVQGSAAGLLTGATKGRAWKDLTDKELGSITFVDSVDFDFSTGLKYVRNEDGVVKAAQVLLPFHFRDSKGKMLQMSDYTKEVGDKTVIDFEKMDPELLKMIGARIPNQGHSSMLPIEVVGFLPEAMGDLIIVPEEITKQMGADFDVDKLFMYQYNYDINPTNNALTKSKPKEIVKKDEFKNQIEGVENGEKITFDGITLNPQQATAYRQIINWNKNNKSSTFTLEGYAGTGKSTIIKKILADLGDSAKVAVSAPTHKAREVIKATTGYEDHTIHSLLGLAPNMDLEKFSPTNIIFDPKKPPTLGKYTHVVVDEASMLNDALYEYLVGTAKSKGVKLIFMGDSAQMPPVGQELSMVFSDVKDRAQLTKVERQANGNPLGPIYDAIRSNLDSGLDMFEHKTNINEKGEGIEFIPELEVRKFMDSLMKDLKENIDSTKVLAWTNKNVVIFNTEIRKKLYPGSKEQIHIGERMLFYAGIGAYSNSEDVTVTATEELVVDGYDVIRTTFDPKLPPVDILKTTPENLNKYRLRLLELEAYANEVKRTTGKGYGWKSFFDFSKTIISPVDILDANGRLITSKKIEYGYALTIHKSQGSTFDNVYVHEGNIDTNNNPVERNKLKYVAFSRPRKKVVSLTNKNETTPVGELEEAPSIVEEVKEAVETENTKKSRQNDYIDIHWKVLTHPEVLPRILAPLDKRGEFSIASESGKIRKIREANKKTTSPLSTEFNITTFKQNSGGKAGVGVFALASTFNAIIQGYDLRLGTTMPDGKEVPLELKMFAGYSLTKLSGPGKNKDGDKSSNISDALSAAVDNAKEQTLDAINLNNATFGAAVAMMQLSTEDGDNLDMTYVTRLLSQKIIVDYVELLENINDSTTTGFFPTRDSIKAEAVKQLKEQYLKGRTEKRVNLNAAGITPDMMIKAIENENEDNVEWVDEQLVFLEAFLEFDNVGTEIKNVQSALNTDAKGLDPTYFKVLQKQEKIQNLQNSPLIRGLVEFMKDSGEFAEYSKANSLAIDVYSRLLMQGSELVQQVLNHHKKEFGLDTMSPDLSQKLYDALKSYLIINKNTISSDIETLRQSLLVDSAESKSLAARVKEAKDTWGKENFLLRRLLPETPEVVGDPAHVEYVAATAERFDEEENIKAFIDMLGNANPKISKLGEDLVSYLFITGGAQSASNFQKFVPVIYLKGANISKRLSDITWKADSNTTVNFHVQFLQHNPDVAPALPNSVNISKRGDFVLPMIDDNSAEMTDGSNGDALRPFVIRKTHALTNAVYFEYVPAFKHYDIGTKKHRLFVRSQDVTGGVLFEEVDVAGGGKNTSEYGKGDSVKTMYSKNKTVASTAIQPAVPPTPITGVQRPSTGAVGNILANYGLSEESSSEEIKAAIDKIANESTNEGFRELAKLLSANFDTARPLTFATDGAMNVEGKYQYLPQESSDVLKINPNFVKTKSQFERVFLHELIHSQTSYLMKMMDSGVKMPANVAKALSSITALRNSVISSFTEAEKAEFEKFKALSSEEKLKSGISKSTKILYYGLASDSEFMTQLLTSSEMQEALNNMPFNSKQTKLQRFVEILANLYKALAENFGIDVKKNSYLEVALSDAVNLLTEIKAYDVSGTVAKPAQQTTKFSIVERTDKIILRNALKSNPTTLYLFGDNDIRRGLGGQAKEMRGEPNAIGISTKKLPARDEKAYKSDNDLEENKRIITEDIDKAIVEWNTGKYSKLMIPQMGVGLAELPTRAPKTYEFLQQELKRLEDHITQRPAQQDSDENSLPFGDSNVTYVDAAPGAFQAVSAYMVKNTSAEVSQKLINKDGTRKTYHNEAAAITAAKALNANSTFKNEFKGAYVFKVIKIANKDYKKNNPTTATTNRPDVYTISLKEIKNLSKPEDGGRSILDQESEEDSILFTDDEIDPAIQKVIDQLENTKTSLRRKHAQEKGDDVLFQARIDVIDSQIEMLKEENSIQAVEVIANAQLTWAENLLGKQSISVSEITEVLNVADAWSNIRELFHGDYSTIAKKKIANIDATATTLKLNALSVAQKIMYQLVKEGSSVKIVEDDMKVMRDTNVGTKNILDISRIDNPAVQKLAEMLHNAARDTNLEFTKIENSIAAAFKKFKETSEFKANGFNVLLQKDKDGNWTGNLAVRYSQAYYDEVKRQEALKKSSGQAGWKNYFKWRRDNEILVDASVLFNSDGSLSSTPGASKHRSELEAEFGKARADEMIDQALTKYTKYLQDLQIIIDNINEQALTNGDDTAMIDAKINAWKIENSPLAYINNYKGLAVIKGAKLNGYKYVVTKPKKIINGKETGWYDKNFEQVENNPAMLEFYNFYRDTMKDLMANLPQYETNKLQNNFIPSIKADLLQHYTKGGAAGALAGLYDGFIDTLSPIESTNVSKDRNVKTGVVNKRVPIRFTGDMSPQEKSTNMIKNLELFALMSLNYKHKTKTEDGVLLMRRIIAEAKEQKTTSFGKDIDGYIVDDSTKLKNTQSAVDLAIDAALYGERRNKGTALRVVLADKLMDSRKATLVAKKIRTARKNHAAGVLSDDEFATQMAELQVEQDKYGGRALTDVDVVDWAIKLTQLKGMALNVFSATTNMTYGVMANFMHAAGREDFTPAQMSKAWSMMLASTSKSLGFDRAGIASDKAKKIHNMIRVVDLLFEVNEAAHSGDTKARSKSALSKLSPYELQKRSEYFIQGQSMLAYMMNVTADSKGVDFTDSTGKKISLLEAFDVDGNIRQDVNLGEGWEGGVDSVAFKKFRNHIIQVNKRVHGNYDPNSFIGMKKTMMGRAAMQFRTWIGEGFATRFEEEKFDRQLDRDVKGTYRTLYDMGFLDTIKGFIKIGMFQGGSLNGMSNVDKANLRKAFVEMNVVIGLFIAGILVSGLDDDDDEEKAKGARIVLNQLYRLQADVTFFDNPTSAKQIMNNIIPALGVVTDFSKAVSNTYKYVTQDESEEDARSIVSADKLMLSWTKNVPFLSQLNKIETNTKKLRPH